MDDLTGKLLLWSNAVRALIGLTLLVGGALGGLEHVTQQNPALLTPLWNSVGLAEATTPAANSTEPAKPATDNPVVQTLAVADAVPSTTVQAPPPVSAAPANPKTADVIVPPVKRVKPVTPPAEPVAVATPEVKTAAVAATAAVGAIAVVAAAKSGKVFAGRSTLGGPVPAATPAAPVKAAKAVESKPIAKATKQAAAKPTPAPALNKRPGFKLTCTSAQKLDVEKQRCVALKGKLATATAKPKA